MNFLNKIKKKACDILKSPNLQIFIEYLFVCVLPSLIVTVFFLILLMFVISIQAHFGKTLIFYPTISLIFNIFFTLVNFGSLYPAYVNMIINCWEKLSFNCIKSKESINNLRLCNYFVYTFLCIFYSFCYLQYGKCDVFCESAFYALMTYLGLDNCKNYKKSIAINNL